MKKLIYFIFYLVDIAYPDVPVEQGSHPVFDEVCSNNNEPNNKGNISWHDKAQLKITYAVLNRQATKVLMFRDIVSNPG
jgi:hypothetical protein